MSYDRKTTLLSQQLNLDLHQNEIIYEFQSEHYKSLKHSSIFTTNAKQQFTFLKKHIRIVVYKRRYTKNEKRTDPNLEAFS